MYVKKEYNILITSDNKEVARFSDILILAVKPYKYFEVIDEIKASLKKDVVIVTIAAVISAMESCTEKSIKMSKK